jgi:hypothetical protein
LSCRGVVPARFFAQQEVKGKETASTARRNVSAGFRRAERQDDDRNDNDWDEPRGLGQE